MRSERRRAAGRQRKRLATAGIWFLAVVAALAWLAYAYTVLRHGP